MTITMKKFIPVVTGAALLFGLISHTAVQASGDDIAKQVATRAVVSIVGSLAGNEMKSIFSKSEALPKPLTKVEIIAAVDDSLGRAKIEEVHEALLDLKDEITSYPMFIEGDEEYSKNKLDRRLVKITAFANNVKNKVISSMSEKNMFQLLPMYIDAIDQWMYFTAESGVVNNAQQNASRDITLKLNSALNKLREFYQQDFIDNGVRKCVLKTDSQWWGNHAGTTIKKQYLGKKGSVYSINIKNKFCQEDMDTASKWNKSYDKKTNERVMKAMAKVTVPPYAEQELAFKDYSWTTDVPNHTMMVSKFKTLPIVYSHRKKLRYWFVRPDTANYNNSSGMYRAEGPYNKEGDAIKARIKYAVHNYQQAPNDYDPRGMGINVAKKMACWAKVVSIHGTPSQKSDVSKIMNDMGVKISECE